MPRGAWFAHAFQIFNALSFTIVLGTPMILFLKHLGAPATVLGIAAAMSPLFTALQIPAASFVDRVGYRAFVLRGWATRSLFVLGVAVVAGLPGAPSPAWRIALVLVLMAGFCIARGIASCGFLPWITQLVPEDVRGQFLSRDQTAIAVASMATSAAVAAYLDRRGESHQFALLFLASYLGAAVSLLFLRRIPDVPPPEDRARAGRVPWLAMAMHPPFLRLMLYNVAAYAVLAGAGVFWVPLLRDQFHASDRYILTISALTSAAQVASLLVFGRLVDRTGSKPLLALSAFLNLAHYALWAAIAARVLPLSWPIAFALATTSGVSGSLFNLANTRLVMGLVPEMGRSHFFALFSVANSVVFGTFPVFWGMAVDGMGSWCVASGPWAWNAYSVLYAALSALMLAVLWLRSRVPEPRAMSTEDFVQELLVRTPARALSRLVERRPNAWS